MKGPCPTKEKPHQLCGWCDSADQCEERKMVKFNDQVVLSDVSIDKPKGLLATVGLLVLAWIRGEPFAVLKAPFKVECSCGRTVFEIRKKAP